MDEISIHRWRFNTVRDELVLDGLFMEISFIEYHFISYPCPKNINIYWNYGFLEGFVIYIQILTGILLGLHYIPNIYSAYYSIIYILREVYFG